MPALQLPQGRLVTSPRVETVLATHRVVAFRPALADVAGDVVAGILLSQILYWWPRATIQREGQTWIAKASKEWWEECRVTEDQARRSLKALRDRGLVETKVWKFNGTPVTHVRLVEAALEEALAALDPSRDDPEWNRPHAQVVSGHGPGGPGPTPETYGAEMTAETTPERTTPSPGGEEDDRDRGFDVFWAAYPRRNGKKLGKAKARTKWRALSYESKRAAYAAVLNYAAAVEAGSTIARDAERFLTSKWWEDWLDGPGDTPAARRGSAAQVKSAAQEYLERKSG